MEKGVIFEKWSSSRIIVSKSSLELAGFYINLKKNIPRHLVDLKISKVRNSL